MAINLCPDTWSYLDNILVARFFRSCAPFEKTTQTVMTTFTVRFNASMRCLVLILLLGNVSIAYAQPQQRPVISQYMFSGLVVNPAYAGNQKQTVVTALHRDQWVNLAGAPKTQTFIVNSALKEYPIGVGLLLFETKLDRITITAYTPATLTEFRSPKKEA